MKRFFLFLLTSATAFQGHAIQAQEPQDTLFYELQAIEVVAARANSNNAATQISAEQIKRDNTAADFPSLLMFTPSLIATSESGMGLGASAISIRGTDAKRINVTVNGMALNDPDSHAMYWYDTPDLAGGSASVQIVRGAGTSTQGTGAFGAGVNIASGTLSNKDCLELSASYGSFNTHREALHFGTGLLRDQWICDLRLSHTATDGYIDRASTDQYSYMAQVGWFHGGTMIKALSFGGKTRTYLTYNGVSEEDMALYGRTYHTSGQYTCPDGPYVLSDGTHVAYFDDQTDNYLQANNQLILDQQFNSELSLNAMLYCVNGRGYYRQYKDDAWLCGYDNLIEGWDQADLIRRKNMVNRRYGLNINGILKKEVLQVVLGAGYMYYKCPHYGTIDWIDGMDENLYKDFRWYDNGAFKNDGNIFGKADWKPLRNLTVHAELQYRVVSYKASGTNDNYDWNLYVMQPINIDQIWHFINPSVNLDWKAGNHNVNASFSIANKEPTRSDFTDRYQFSSLQDDPKPERLYDWELSYRYSSSVLNAGACLYYMKYKDQLIPSGVVNDSGDNLNENVPDSYRMGVELDAKIKTCKYLDLGANCTFSKNEINGSGRLPYSPECIAAAIAEFHAKGFEAILRAQYVSRQYVEDWSLDPYYFANLDLGYTIPWRHKTRIGLKINNITDHQYSSYGYPGYLFPQAGRHVIGVIDITF